ncbi:rCG56747, partial [Rattus norvegicus]
MFSLCVSREGNLPALFRPGPRIRGICLIRDSE